MEDYGTEEMAAACFEPRKDEEDVELQEELLVCQQVMIKQGIAFVRIPAYLLRMRSDYLRRSVTCA